MSSGIHSTRTMVVIPQQPNLVLLQVGSNSNWDYATGSTSSGRSMVKVFDMSKAPAGGYQYNTAGVQLGYGMRNEIGLALDPAGHVWGVANSGDMSGRRLEITTTRCGCALTRTGLQDFKRTVNGQAVDIHNDNPAGELNYRKSREPALPYPIRTNTETTIFLTAGR